MKLYVEEEWQRVPSGGTSLMLPTPDVQLKGGRDERRAHVGTVPRRKATEAAHATPACSSAMGRGKAVEALPPQVFWERLWRLRRPTTVI